VVGRNIYTERGTATYLTARPICRNIYAERGAATYLTHSLVFSLEDRAWQEPEPSHVTGMALGHCILGKFLGVVCHCFSPPLDIPTLATTREILAAKDVGEKDVR